MKSIAKLDSNLTVIIIAHRISTLSNCDSIIQIENGKIIKQDSYDYFINNKSIFLNEK
jgi:ABC-type multidrug transport system fused ATPase/permease subunit